jgi:pyruvate formate lyase activating enzyme
MKDNEKYKEARYYDKNPNLSVKCNLCPHKCIIKPGASGICRVRKNIDGKLYTLNYGKVTSIALDPIEKKPLYQFYPGSYILSLGTFGCNFKCPYCQNWEIAHEEPESYGITPEKAVLKAKEFVEKGSIGLAYTYNEPSIWYEFVYDTAVLAKEEGLSNVLVTNGYISHKPLQDILPYIDAFNIDVKSFDEDFYKKICNGTLEDVKETVEIVSKSCHVELTSLIIPGLNDSISNIEKMAKWIYSISSEIPLHITRFFPHYKMNNIPPTPVETLIKLKDTAGRYLKYVYVGNVA